LKWLVLALLVACSGDEPSGFYMETSVVDFIPCGSDAMQVDPLYMNWSDSLFDDGLGFKACTGPDDMGCSEGPSKLSFPLTEHTDDGWSGESYIASYVEGECVLDDAVATATLSPRGVLVYEANQFSARVTATPAECTSELTKQMKATLPCAVDLRVTAQRL
jgi:hypothetical protein